MGVFDVILDVGKSVAKSVIGSVPIVGDAVNSVLSGLGAYSSSQGAKSSQIDAEYRQQQYWRENTDYMQQLNVQNAQNAPLYSVIGADRAGLSKATLGQGAFTGTVQSPSGAPGSAESYMAKSPVLSAIELANLQSDIDLKESQAEKNRSDALRNDIQNSNETRETWSRIALNAAQKAATEMQTYNLSTEYEQKSALRDAFGSWTEYGQHVRKQMLSDWANVESQIAVNRNQSFVYYQTYVNLVDAFQKSDLYLKIAQDNAKANLTSAGAAYSQANTAMKNYNFSKDRYDNVGKSIDEFTRDYIHQRARIQKWEADNPIWSRFIPAASQALQQGLMMGVGAVLK